MRRCTSWLLLVLAVYIFPTPAYAGLTAAGEGLKFGVPFSDNISEDEQEKCPRGAQTIGVFLTAWQQEDYETMYALVDDKSKAEFSFEDARFYFQLLEFKPYEISSVRKKGENFEFILSYGNYRDRDEDTNKMVIDGSTFKIIMPAKKSLFRESAGDLY